MAKKADFNFFLDQRNPYKKPNIGGSMFGAGDSSIYPTYADMLNGTAWQNDQIAKNNAAEASLGAPSSTSLASPVDTSNPFTTLRNVKNPGIDAAAQSVLGQITSLSGPQTDTMVRSTRSQNLADRLSDEFHNFDTDREGNRATLADFTSGFIAAAPQATEQTNQEINSVGQFYDGTVRGELDKLAGARRIATAGALTPAIQSVLKGRNMGALLGGNDSYLDSQVLDRAGRLSRDAAVDNAEQLKNNYLYERAGQERNVGVRSRLLDANLMRGLVPTQVGQQINQNDLSRLYSLGAAENANTNYRTTNPQMELAMKLGLLGDTSRLDLQNTFYGLKKPYEPNTSGYLAGMPRRWDGGGGDTFSGGGYPSAVEAILANNAQPNIGTNTVTNGGPSPLPAGTRYVRNPDGSMSAVPIDPLAGQYWDDPNFGMPTGTPEFPAGQYWNSTIPTWEGFDAMPLPGGYA